MSNPQPETKSRKTILATGIILFLFVVYPLSTGPVQVYCYYPEMGQYDSDVARIYCMPVDWLTTHSDVVGRIYDFYFGVCWDLSTWFHLWWEQ